MARSVSNPLKQNSWSLNPRSIFMGVAGAVVMFFVLLSGAGIAQPLVNFVLGTIGRVTGLNTGGDSGVDVV